MFTRSNTGIAFLLISFILSVICFLQFNFYYWAIYPAIAFSLVFVIQLFMVVRNSGLNFSLKKDIYALVGLLIVVVISNILWVFVIQWFRYVASIASLVFVGVLLAKLRNWNVV